MLKTSQFVSCDLWCPEIFFKKEVSYAVTRQAEGETYCARGLDLALPPSGLGFLPDKDHLPLLQSQLFFASGRVRCNHRGQFGLLTTFAFRLKKDIELDTTYQINNLNNI